MVDDALDRLSQKVRFIHLQPLAPLQYIPWDFSCKRKILSQAIKQVLSFTIQNFTEVALVVKITKREKNVDDHKALLPRYYAYILCCITQISRYYV